MTLAEALAAATGELTRRGVEHPRLDAERLVARALSVSRLDLYTDGDRPLTVSEWSDVTTLIERRAHREPLAYVLGDWDFRRLKLKTDGRALVPRPETEIVVERALAHLQAVTAPRVVDVGTGSGAIALAIADERRDARIVATDVDAAALSLARENAESAGLAIQLVEADLLDGLAGPFDLIVSNPPYVRAEELEALEPEVRDWEPRGALVDDGQTERLLSTARHVLNGWLVVEIHEDDARGQLESAERLGYRATVTNDLADRPRVLEAEWRQTPA